VIPLATVSQTAVFVVKVEGSSMTLPSSLVAMSRRASMAASVPRSLRVAANSEPL
jgi:hypothetical protein